MNAATLVPNKNGRPANREFRMPQGERRPGPSSVPSSKYCRGSNLQTRATKIDDKLNHGFVCAPHSSHFKWSQETMTISSLVMKYVKAEREAQMLDLCPATTRRSISHVHRARKLNLPADYKVVNYRCYQSLSHFEIDPTSYTLTALTS